MERGFADIGYALANQGCETRRAICDSTRDIIDNQNAGVRSILDFLTNDKIATLTAENQSLKFAASQAAQNAYLVSELRPSPIPSYTVANPYCCQGNFNAFCCAG
jgi:predicted peptidase